MSSKHYIEDKSDVMLGMMIEYIEGGVSYYGEIVSFLQASPDMLYVVRRPACLELILINPDDVKVFEWC